MVYWTLVINYYINNSLVITVYERIAHSLLSYNVDCLVCVIAVVMVVVVVV